ncbi:MAG: SRPBCC family protein [Aeoliella sp.]
MVRSATAHETQTLTVRRKFPVDQQTLYQAWTDPDQVAKWFGPTPEHSVEVREYELRVGGKYQLAFSKGGEPATDVVAGVFQEISAPERVSYTWAWLPPSTHAGDETLVTVEFIAAGKETELVLTHDRFTDDEARSSHQQGWGGCLESLAAHLTAK